VNGRNAVRVGLIGAGLAGRSHAFDVVTTDGLQLAGVAGGQGTSARDTSALFGCTLYPDADALLSDSTVDAVIIAVPPHTVFPLLLRTVESGKPCLVEKPIARTTAQCELLQQLMKRTPAVVAPFNRRYLPHVRHARQLIDDGAIGSVNGAEACWQGAYRVRFGAETGTYRAAAGTRSGVLLDSGTHALDTLVYLLAEVLGPIHVTTTRLIRNERGADVEAELLAIAEDGCSIRFSAADDPSSAPDGNWQLHITGSTGLITLDRHGLLVSRVQDPEPSPVLFPEAERPAADLRRVVHGQSPLGAGLFDALAVSNLVASAYDQALPVERSWSRPRAKALGRLNGSC